MHRRRKGPMFKMKSGNKTTFKMMGSTSPMRNPDNNKQETYSKTLDMVTADMTNAELRDLARGQHIEDGVAKAHKYNVPYNALIRQRRTLINSQKNKQTEVKKPAETTTTTSSDSDELTGYVISNEDQERIFTQHGGGVLKGAELEARNKALRDAAARY